MKTIYPVGFFLIKNDLRKQKGSRINQNIAQNVKHTLTSTLAGWLAQ
jgi:hypothetical protein